MRLRPAVFALVVLASLCETSGASPVPQPPELWTVTADGSSEAAVATGPEGSFMRRDFEWSPDGGRLVFTKLGDIWTSAPDGTDQLNLTASEAEEYDPHWSPDGMEIVFVRTTGDGSDLYVAAADGSGVRPLTTDEGYERIPRWSPTGEWILFQTICIDCDEDLGLIRPDGSARVPLTDDDVRDLIATWSPDGTQIAIVRGPGTTTGNELGVIDVNGTAFTSLATDVMAEDPEWSSDGSWISVRSLGRVVAVEVSTGAIRRPATPGDLDTDDPAWAPAELRLAITEASNLLVYDVASDSAVLLASVPLLPPGAGVSLGAQDPEWSPDGSEIVFGFNHDLAIVPADGGDVRHIGSTPDTIESAPRWSPDASRIAYLATPIPGGGMRIITLVASDNVVTYDKTFRLGGSITPESSGVPQECIGEVPVMLLRSVLGTRTSEVVATTTSESSGSFRFGGLRGDRSANYVVQIEEPVEQCGPAVSAPESVNVRKKVILSGPPTAGGRVRLKADVGPCKGHRHDRVLLQKRRGGEWVTVDRDRSDDRCRAVFVQDIGRRSVFRAKAPKTDADHLAGTSATLVIHVD